MIYKYINRDYCDSELKEAGQNDKRNYQQSFAIQSLKAETESRTDT